MATYTDRSDREQFVTAAKIAVGVLVGAIMATVVGPIILAIIVGAAEGH